MDSDYHFLVDFCVLVSRSGGNNGWLVDLGSHPRYVLHV